jgi:hypothetical protein
MGQGWLFSLVMDSSSTYMQIVGADKGGLVDMPLYSYISNSLRVNRVMAHLRCAIRHYGSIRYWHCHV